MTGRRGAALALALAAAAAGQAETESDPRAAWRTELTPALEAMAAAASRGEAEQLERMVDLAAVMDRALAGAEGDAEQLRDFRRGAIASMRWGTQIAAHARGGSYSFRRWVRRDGEWRALLRLIGGNGSSNYHEYVLDPDSEVPRVVDAYVYASGELLSTTLRRGYDLASGEGSEEFQRHLGDVRELTGAVRAGRFAEALAAYESLPAALQRDKTYLVMRLQAASGLGDMARYRQALADVERFVAADDPARMLLLIDAYFMDRRWDEVVAILDRLRARVGEDSYVDYVRAGVERDRGELDLARRLAEAAVQREPELAGALEMLITIALRQRDHAATRRGLDDYTARFGGGERVSAWLRAQPGYRAFAASPQGETWR